jgi:hypothetical protein
MYAALGIPLIEPEDDRDYVDWNGVRNLLIARKHNITNNVSMQERKIIICRGTRSSGKTDWTKQWVLKDPEHRVRFSDSDIRDMLGKHQAPEREVLVSAMKRQFIITALRKCYDVVYRCTLKPNEDDFC